MLELVASGLDAAAASSPLGSFGKSGSSDDGSSIPPAVTLVTLM